MLVLELVVILFNSLMFLLVLFLIPQHLFLLFLETLNCLQRKFILFLLLSESKLVLFAFLSEVRLHGFRLFRLLNQITISLEVFLQ
jgi:hypothetical protein